MSTTNIGSDMSAPTPNPEAGQWVAQRLNRVKRRCDVAGHYGLHGFLLLMVHTPGKGGLTCCRRLQRILEAPAATNAGPRGPVRACFGLASHGTQTASPQALLRTAEDHLEAARIGAGDRLVSE